jgi:hypothetical protein
VKSNRVKIRRDYLPKPPPVPVKERVVTSIASGLTDVAESFRRLGVAFSGGGESGSRIPPRPPMPAAPSPTETQEYANQWRMPRYVADAEFTVVGGGGSGGTGVSARSGGEGRAGGITIGPPSGGGEEERLPRVNGVDSIYTISTNLEVFSDYDTLAREYVVLLIVPVFIQENGVGNRERLQVRLRLPRELVSDHTREALVAYLESRVTSAMRQEFGRFLGDRLVPVVMRIVVPRILQTGGRT